MSELKSKLTNLILSFCLGFLVGMCIFLIANRLLVCYQKNRALKQELIFWKKVVSQHPEYPDGWAKLATIWYNLHHRELARLAIEKARRLDPVREELKNLEAKIKK